VPSGRVLWQFFFLCPNRSRTLYINFIRRAHKKTRKSLTWPGFILCQESPHKTLCPLNFHFPLPKKKKNPPQQQRPRCIRQKLCWHIFFLFELRKTSGKYGRQTKKKKRNRKDATGWPKLRGHPLIARKPWDYKDRP